MSTSITAQTFFLEKLSRKNLLRKSLCDTYLVTLWSEWVKKVVKYKPIREIRVDKQLVKEGVMKRTEIGSTRAV